MKFLTVENAIPAAGMAFFGISDNFTVRLKSWWKENLLTKSLIVLIFHFGSGFFFTTKKNGPQLVWKSKKRFFKEYSNEANGILF